MFLRHLLLASGAALLAVTPVLAAPETCTAPGTLVIEDATGDQGVPPAATPPPPAPAVVPVPLDSADIVSVGMAEPAGTQLVFTYKVASLADAAPDMAWIVRFSTDELPADGYEDFFVAAVNGPDQSTRFVYGRTGFQVGAPAGEPRQFVVDGDLEAGSGTNADGTLTLILDRTKVPGINVGGEIFNMLATVRVVTPADPGLPFFTNADNSTILDEADAGAYDLVGSASCGKQGSGFAAGALGPLTLLFLLLPALRRRR